MSRVDVNGVGIEYQVTGQGRPVVLLHGFPDSGRLWRHQAAALAAAGFQVIVPDLRGYGLSDKPSEVEEQCQKSWYMLLFPGVAERWLTENNWANLRGTGHPDADQVIADLAQLEAPDKVSALLLDFLPR
jgi:pimeloyl-ACP methyl ester carboxylesterase